MNTLVSYELDDCTKILVEVDDKLNPEGEAIVARDFVVEEAYQTFKQAISPLKSITQAFLEPIKNLENRPSEFEISFGLHLNQTGTIISQNTESANFSIRLIWKDKP